VVWLSKSGLGSQRGQPAAGGRNDYRSTVAANDFRATAMAVMADGIDKIAISVIPCLPKLVKQGSEG
jgi:hypothetical protein